MEKELNIIETKDWPKEQLALLLRALDYDTDGEFVLKGGKRHLDKYTGEEIRIRNMAIFPHYGKALVIDGNPMSISSYLVEMESKSEGTKT